MQTHFFARIGIAFKILFSRSYTEQLVSSSVSEATATPEPVTLTSSNTDGALQLLSLLQKEGRLLDFINEDVTAFSDDQIGAAARVVHQGLNKAIKEHITLEPVAETVEGSPITLADGFDTQAYRLTGNINGSAPFNGTLIHKGWRATRIELPQTVEGYEFSILAPAEVEL
ncbi:DUF2760 domain-containing protein [Corallincola platygyrae]|uniref:DUF2760 domain-containing protein n=1 Tax=Corallincola platygyrae TaxID=1193278 RepID=A0ABW4XSY3_9GAMM